jgi:hypothetical protein
MDGSTMQLIGILFSSHKYFGYFIFEFVIGASFGDILIYA